jgi:uncharacterized protein (TIGR02246 family)
MRYALACLLSVAACTSAETELDLETMTEFGARYTAAWSNHDASAVASFYSENGSLTVNDGDPAVGRDAIATVAQSFMTAFPDFVLEMDSVRISEGSVEYHWTFAGTNTGPEGTGKAVRFSGYEEWTMGSDGLVAESQGHFDEAEYNRQLEAGFGATEGEALSADGVPIRYETHGAGDPALVLVHGWTNSRAIWGIHPQTLARRHRVVALDLAGHGVSGADRADWTVYAFGQDIAAVVEQLELESVVLVGFSMGAGVVLAAAEQLGSRVLGVVFVDELKDPEYVPNPGEIEQIIPVMRQMWGDTAGVRAFGFTPEAPDSLIDYVVEMMGEQPREYWFDIARAYDAWITNDLKPTLERVEVPLAAINTPMPPTNVEAWRRYDASFTVDTMAGVGHAGILLRRVEDFDARLLAIVDRFVSTQAAHRAK